ncbi:hypothetical protein Goshw_010740 [Gossypium schwendimanii]|uniref:Uncharacterized protein n=1 Tax=Gossypium schwendimanii TaxID=34291 RepID=A0A7J9LUY7_GOSSC|nr:hypothetical protein [Gossypium schwendimanii]
MVESVRGRRGSGLPCGRCQRFESAYLQLGEVQMRKSLRWIPRHPKMRKGIVSDEML